VATFTTTGWYFVEFSDGQYRTLSSIDRTPTSITNNLADSVFRVDQLVTVTFPGYIDNETVVAFTTDGIITRNALGDYALQTSNESYIPGVALDTNSNPFPVCFVKGTLIDTNDGPVTIESLGVGDQVVGSTGLRTVKWVGWRHYHAVSLHTPAQREACMPVRILAGALADNLPTQDLRVSPWHHLYIDGVLVRAKDLINGMSVIQETQIQEFAYYHVELDQFDVVRAHGVYSESWADGGNRDFFQNVDVTRLHPEDMTRRMAQRPGFKVLRKAADIASVHGRIAERAKALFLSSDAKAA
jgi:hypothetical protein